MDDIEEVIKKASHYKFEDESHLNLLNPLSSLPASKANLKRSIKERISLLTAAYISLASFIPDDEYEYISDKKQEKRIYRKVLRDIDKLTKEIKDFNPFELPTV